MEVNKLKVGDPVFVHRKTTKTLSKVERITKTQIIINGGRKYRRQTGDEIGVDTRRRGGWKFTSIKFATDEDISEYNIRNRKEKMIYDAFYGSVHSSFYSIIKWSCD